MSPDLLPIVRTAAGRPEIRDAVGEVYEEIAREVAARRPICTASGKCCRFEQFGHRMFVTTAELAAFLHDVTGVDQAWPTWDGTGCPFQARGLCGVHAIRPMGCRIFYCDPTAEQWQNDLYERLHASIKRIHERFDVPYFYLEWREALRALGLASPVAENSNFDTPGERVIQFYDIRIAPSP